MRDRCMLLERLAQPPSQRCDDERGGGADVEGQDPPLDVVPDRQTSGKARQSQTGHPESHHVIPLGEQGLGGRVVPQERDDLHGRAPRESPEEHLLTCHMCLLSELPGSTRLVRPGGPNRLPQLSHTSFLLLLHQPLPRHLLFDVFHQNPCFRVSASISMKLDVAHVLDKQPQPTLHPVSNVPSRYAISLIMTKSSGWGHDRRGSGGIRRRENPKRPRKPSGHPEVAVDPIRRSTRGLSSSTRWPADGRGAPSRSIRMTPPFLSCSCAPAVLEEIRRDASKLR